MLKLKVFLLFLLLMFFGVTVNAAEDRYIIKFNDSVQMFSADGETDNKDFISVPADELQDYIDAGVVEYYEPDYEIELFASEEDRYWNLDSIRAVFPRIVGCVGTNVKIGIIDSGIVDGIASNVLTGYNYIDKNTDTTDNTMHGTWVSAFAASSGFGVAPDAQFVPLKCFDSERSNLSYAIEAIVDAVDVYDCDVINMSFGVIATELEVALDGSLRTFKEKIDYAVSKGVILVASVGNDKDSSIRYPAAFDNVIGVGSVNKDGVKSDFSNYNKSVHVVAPGEEVWAPCVENGKICDTKFYLVDGTSFSAPHVSGLAAVARSIKPDITHTEFAQLLADTAIETEADEIEGWDEKYGYGLIDCEAAIKKLIEGQKIHISPIWLNSKANAVIYNNTSERKKTFSVCVYYDEQGRMKECNPAWVEIGAGRTYHLTMTRQSGTVKYMALSDDGKLTPLAISKER